MFNDKRSAIGIDVGGSAIRLVQLETAGQGAMRLAAAAEVALDEGLQIESATYHQAVTEAIQQAKKRDRFTGKAAISTLPAAAVQCKNLRLPKMPDAELAKAVEFEARDRLQLGDRPHMVRYFDGGEVRQGEEIRREVIALAAANDLVHAHTQAISDAGLQLAAVDVIPAALARPFAAAPSETAAALSQPSATDPSTDQARVIVDLGHDSTKVLITRNDQIVFFKLIEVAGQRFTQAVAQACGLSTAQAKDRRSNLDPSASSHELNALEPIVTELGREIALCLRYYSVTFRGDRPSEARLVGGEASQPWLESMLSDHAGITLTAADPVCSRFGGQAQITQHGGAWVTATGLALRSVEPGKADPSHAASKSKRGDANANSTVANPSANQRAKGAAA